jgi:hypothetical protein
MAHTTNFKHDMKSRVDEKIEAEKAEAKAEREVYALVDARDKRICRCCGHRTTTLGLTTRTHHHHLVYRSAGGEHSTANIVTLCPACHNDEHKHRLRIEGNADVGLTFKRPDQDDEGRAQPVWFITRHEVSPGVIDRD